MKMSRQRAMVLAMCLAGATGQALATDSTLTLVMGGEAYDGPPKFSVSFAGQLIGEGTVAAAIDTGSAQRGVVLLGDDAADNDGDLTQPAFA